MVLRRMASESLGLVMSPRDRFMCLQVYSAKDW